jgi:DNA-binding CsgD family transcriptional regulator
MGSLLGLERELAGVMTLADAIGQVLEGFRRLVGAAGATVFSFDHQGTPAARGGSLEQSMQNYTPEFFAADTLQAFNRRVSRNTFLNFGAGFDWGQWVRSGVYADFYRRHDIGCLCGVLPTGLPYGSSGMFGLLLVTPTLSQPFRETDYDKLRHFEAPLRSAARRIVRFQKLNQDCDMLRQLLERQQGSFVLWDPEGRLVCVSSRAQLLLAEGLHRSDLEPVARLALRQLQKADPAASQRVLGRPQRLTSGRGSPLLVEFSWIAGSDQRRWLLAELEECADERARLAGLTGAETRVLRLLVRGLANREIGELLDVSNETVKTHVKRILAKLGVNSRAKAANIAREAWASSPTGSGVRPLEPLRRAASLRE